MKKSTGYMLAGWGLMVGLYTGLGALYWQMNEITIPLDDKRIREHHKYVETLAETRRLEDIIDLYREKYGEIAPENIIANGYE